jgi:phosphomannomutase
MNTTDPANTVAVFKAYDVRGVVPDQIDETLARRTGAAFVPVAGARTVVVGHDMRPSSPALAAPAPTWC